MALAVPDAFQDEAAWFAVAYFVARVLNSTLYAWGVLGDPGQLRAVARLTPWFVLAAALAAGTVVVVALPFLRDPAPASDALHELDARGRALLESKGCPSCHVFTGVPALTGAAKVDPASALRRD